MNNILLGAFILFFLLLSLREWIAILKHHPFLRVSLALLVIGIVYTQLETEIAAVFKAAIQFGIIAAGTAFAVCVIAAIFTNR